MKPLAPNTTLQNRYKITEMIGKGGMGEVYLAIDQRLGHTIALKRTTVGDDQLLTEAFEREARTLAQLRHPVLPKVSDHFTEDGEQFLVMDYISGEDLFDRLTYTNKAFPLNWVMFWADQLLDALSYLHAYDPPIIHRDIKPQNLKLTNENHIVLLDFGLSKNALGKTQVTSSGSVLGYTPHYASMEQIRGTGTNAKSDIFSLSATLYHLISSECPPDALSRADNLLSGIDDPLKPLTELNPEVNSSISEHILRGMEITQEKRFETARDMQKALRRAYNQMQESMSAETAAFNVQDVGIENTEEQSVGDKTEVMSGFPANIEGTSASENLDSVEPNLTENDKNLDPTMVGGYRPDDISTEKTEVINSEDFQVAVGDRDINATVDYSDDSVKNNIETSLDENQKNTQDVSFEDSVFKTQDNIADDGDFDAENLNYLEDDSDVKDINPDATVPLISFDDSEINGKSDGENTNDTNWDDSFVSEKTPANEVEPNEDKVVSATAGVTDNFTNIEIEEEPEASAEHNKSVVSSSVSSSSKEGNSNGKYIAMLAGFGAVLFLTLGAVLAGGYYYTNGGFSSSKDINRSEAEKTPEITQSEVEPTPELADTENAEQTDTPTNSENIDETIEDADKTQLDSADEITKDTESKLPSKSKAKKTKTASSKTKTSSKTSTRPNIKTVKKTTKKKPVKTKKTPAKKKKKKKDAGVL